MSNENELADNGILSVPEAIREIWDSLTTSQKLQAVTPEMAKAYRLEKENQRLEKENQAHLQDLTKVVLEIRQMKLEERQERKTRENALYRLATQAMSLLFPGRK